MEELENISFHDIFYTVKTGKKEEKELEILHGISGKIRKGRLFAILGQSGSGKSSALNVLAGRATGGFYSGSIRVNGKEIPRLSKWRKMCGYVMQHDRLLSTSTVFETLMFSSQLRRPYSVTYNEHVEIVDEILKELSLSHRKHTRVGNPETAKSLSGGELRRVSIGIELVAKCRILMLDEPTSGLDFSTARDIVSLLSKIAKSGFIVGTTIHQPSSAICSMFDDMMLLSKGHVCYHGPWNKTVDHLNSFGAKFQCPQYTNIADFFMDLSTDDDAVEVMRKNAYVALGQGDETPAGLGDQVGENDLEKDNGDEDDDDDDNENTKVGAFQTPFWFQFKILWIRSFKQWYRNDLMLITELTEYVVFGLFIGLMYHTFSDNLENGSFDRLSALFFILTTICFIPSFTVVTLYGEERPLLVRETNAGMYRISAQFLAKMCTTWPFELVLALLFLCCCYFLCGFVPTFSKFAIFFVVVVLFQLISETIGYLSAIATPTPTIGVLLLSVILLVCLALGGFLVSEPNPGLEWFDSINFFVFAFTALSINEFESLTLYPAGTDVGVNGLEFLRQQGRVRNNLTIWENIAVLVGILIVSRLLAYVGLFFRLRGTKLKKVKGVEPDSADIKITLD